MTGTYTIQDFGPSDLLTSEKEGFRRIRVDAGQTATGVFSSFFEERP